MKVKIFKCETHPVTDENGKYIYEEKNGIKHLVYMDGAEELEEKVNSFLRVIEENTGRGYVEGVISIQYQVASGGGDQDPFVEYTAMIFYDKVKTYEK